MTKTAHQISTIPGLLSSAANVDASDIDTTMSGSVDVTEGSDKMAIGGKTETMDLCYSSSDDSSLSISKVQTLKHQKPYLKLVQHNPAPEMTKKYHFQQLINQYP